jgi:hypothetical protein
MRKRLRQALGAMPVSRLNKRRKKAGSSQPTRQLMSSIASACRARAAGR